MRTPPTPIPTIVLIWAASLAVAGCRDSAGFAASGGPAMDEADAREEDGGGQGGGGGGGDGGGAAWEDGEEGGGPAEGEGEAGAGDGDAGWEPPPLGCAFDEDCGGGYVCIVGRCVFRGGEPERPEVCRGLPTDRPSLPTAPATGDRYVFLALPGTPAVARIDVESLAVDEIALRAEALAITTLPGRDVAVALLGAGRAAVIGAEGDAEPVVTEVAVRHGLTRLSPSPATAHVVAWADHDGAATAERNPSEVSVLDLSEAGDLARVDPAVYHLSVGTRPREVAFAEPGGRLLVVTDDGVSLTDLDTLDADQILPPVPVHEDAVGSDPEARRVVLTPDGAYAVVLQPGEPALRIVDLLAETAPLRLDLDAPPTDLDLVPGADAGGAVRRAVAVLGDAGQALLLDIPGDFLGGGLPEVIELETPVCQVTVSPSGREAALFSAVAEAPALVRVGLSEGGAAGPTVQVERLPATILGVVWSPDGGTAVAIHSAVEGAPLFSMMTFADGFFSKSFSPGGAWRSFQFTPDTAPSGQRFLVTLTGFDGVRHELWSVPTASFIAAQVPLRARPVDLGIIPAANQAYVTQDDPEGLIAFISLGPDHESREVSRFRRNRRVD